VKKLHPDFNKQGRRVNMQDVRPGQNRDNRPQQNAQRPGFPGSGPRPQGAAPEQNRGENRENREGRDSRDGRRDNRDGRGDRNRDGRRDGRGDRNRDGRGDRNRDGRERRPEIMGNETSEQAFVPSEAPASVETEVRTSFDSRPSLEGRRPLEPRTTEPVVSESASVQSSEAPVAASEGVMDFDPSRIRHGRRPMIRKTPALEEPTTPPTNV